MRPLYLKKREDRRLKAGHLWIFSNEVDVQKSPLIDFAPGEAADVRDAGGSSIATAYVNPATLICARIVSRSPLVPLDATMLRQRLGTALSLRQNLFATPFYRLCYGEGDFLPGLVVDRYDDVLAVQISTAGMEQCRDAIVGVLTELLHPRCIALRNDIAARDLEHLPRESKDLLGISPEFLDVAENGAMFRIPFAAGQKTGWFYDQRRNRAEAASHAKGRSVLDAFCYAGGFGVACALGGATSVSFLDASDSALNCAKANLTRNAPQVAEASLHLHKQGDALQILRDLREEGTRFGLVSIDPPAFIKRRKDVSTGLAAYRKINGLALDLLADDGILVTSSCSHHLEAEALRQALMLAAAKRSLHGQILWQGTQGPDHPIHTAMPETAYLKCLVARFYR